MKRKLRVMLIEDNPQNRYLARFLLEQHGHEVAEVENAVKGLRALEDNPQWPDIVVLDIQMPEMDGYEAAVAIRASPALSHLPLLAVTSFAMVGDRSRAIESGFSEYLEKPFEPEAFVQAVESLGLHEQNIVKKESQ
jgi:two-component system, cell cycle response regulator DivK